MKNAVFVDRDGVINVYRANYVKSWDEFVFLPGTFEAFRKLAVTPYSVVIVSNQSIIGRGMVEQDSVDVIHHCMVSEIMSHGGRVDEVVYCPHHPDVQCACRKPNPGMLLQVSSRANVDLTSSFFIGDAPSDVEAAIAAGCIPLLVLTGRGRESQQQLLAYYPNLVIVANLLDAVEWIQTHQQQ